MAPTPNPTASSECAMVFTSPSIFQARWLAKYPAAESRAAHVKHPRASTETIRQLGRRIAPQKSMVA